MEGRTAWVTNHMCTLERFGAVETSRFKTGNSRRVAFLDALARSIRAQEEPFFESGVAGGAVPIGEEQ